MNRVISASLAGRLCHPITFQMADGAVPAGPSATGVRVLHAQGQGLEAKETALVEGSLQGALCQDSGVSLSEP